MPITALRDVDLRHLLALRAVHEHGTFGRAAASLGFTQSAISQQIAALERIVGESLFDRPGGPKPVTLTAAGEMMLGHAMAILDRLEAAQTELDGYKAGRSGRVRLGTFQSITVRILPALLNVLRERHPEIVVLPHELDDQEVMLRMLDDGELDAAFVVGPLGDGRFASRVIGLDDFVVICPTDSSILRGPGAVATADLGGVPLVGQPQVTCQMVIEDGLRTHGVEPLVVFRTGDNAAVQALVRVGMGHAVMPGLAVDRGDQSVAIRELDPPLPPRQLEVAWSRSRGATPALERLVPLIAEVAAAAL